MIVGAEGRPALDKLRIGPKLCYLKMGEGGVGWRQKSVR
jgi:hypothetical protein